MEKRKAAFHNLGCKVNAYETEAMQQLLEKAGYEIVPFAPGADVYVINTCTVTNMADRKSRQMLHKAKKMNPHAIVVAAGCYVQAAGTELEEDSAIDIIIGNNRKKDLVSILEHYERSAVQESLIDINHTKEYEKLSLEKTVEHTRAYLKVQDGCNQFCSYCIIPYARGRVRSRRKEEVVEEVKTLAGNGCKEVVLTGIHLSSYGIDHGSTLQELILAVHEVAGVERIRLGSLEPGIITEDFVKTLSALPKFCPHFHLSLQSGCDATLKRMNRKYTTSEVKEIIERLRRYYDDVMLTTDIIVGFPGETEEEFETTYQFLKQAKLYKMHVFQYSPRKGTRAAVMPNQIDGNIKEARSKKLIELSNENQKMYNQQLVGKEAEVLFEDKEVEDGITYFRGHTQNYVLVKYKTDENLENTLKLIKISDISELPI